MILEPQKFDSEEFRRYPDRSGRHPLRLRSLRLAALCFGDRGTGGVEKANLIRVSPGGAILRIALEAYLQSRPGRTGMKSWQDELLRIR